MGSSHRTHTRCPPGRSSRCRARRRRGRPGRARPIADLPAAGLGRAGVGRLRPVRPARLRQQPAYGSSPRRAGAGVANAGYDPLTGQPYSDKRSSPRDCSSCCRACSSRPRRHRPALRRQHRARRHPADPSVVVGWTAPVLRGPSCRPHPVGDHLRPVAVVRRRRHRRCSPAARSTARAARCARTDRHPALSGRSSVVAGPKKRWPRTQCRRTCSTGLPCSTPGLRCGRSPAARTRGNPQGSSSSCQQTRGAGPSGSAPSPTRRRSRARRSPGRGSRARRSPERRSPGRGSRGRRRPEHSRGRGARRGSRRRGPGRCARRGSRDRPPATPAAICMRQPGWR